MFVLDPGLTLRRCRPRTRGVHGVDGEVEEGSPGGRKAEPHSNRR